MKELGMSLGILGALTCGIASAENNSVQLNCRLSTRVVTGNLSVKVNPTEGYLSYELTKTHHTKADQNFELTGSNQEGFGSSGLSWSSVSFTKLNGGQTKITAHGEYFERATLVGKTEIEILLIEKGYSEFGQHSLVSFKLNGKEHLLERPNYCDLY